MSENNTNKCVFLDRDGVLNEERGTYTFKIEDFIIIDGVKEALKKLKNAGFTLVVVTNQAGITRGIFTREDMKACHDYLQNETGNQIDAIYYAPNYPDFSNSLVRKPDSLMFEKAIYRFKINPSKSYMIGNSARDLVPAIKLGIKTMHIGPPLQNIQVNYYVNDLTEATKIILQNQGK